MTTNMVENKRSQYMKQFETIHLTEGFASVCVLADVKYIDEDIARAASAYCLEHIGVTDEIVQIAHELEALDIEYQCEIISHHKWLTSAFAHVDQLETPFPNHILHGEIPLQHVDVNFEPWLKVEEEYKKFSNPSSL